MNTITLTKTKRKLAPKRLAQYGVLIAVAYFAFKMFDNITKQNQQVNNLFDDNELPIPAENNDFDTGNDQFEFDKHEEVNMDVEEIAARERLKLRHKKKPRPKKEEVKMADNVDELNQMVEEEEQAEKKQKHRDRKNPKKGGKRPRPEKKDPEEEEDLNNLKEEVIEEFDKRIVEKAQPIDHKKGNRQEFDTGIDSPEIAKEKLKRRMKFFQKMEELTREFDEPRETDIHEDVEMLIFVSAAWSQTFNDVVNLVVSIQNHYVTAEIIIYDIGLEPEQKQWLSTVCQVEVIMSFIEVWPAHIKDLESKLWRPIILQMAMAQYSHFIWVEPHLIINRQKINAYIEHSKKFGVLLAGNRQKYSSFVVTHPDMYYYLSSDTRKLGRVPHFEINMIIMHNTATVQQKLMKWLVACTIEEWCIAPTGSKRSCDMDLRPNAKYYANCHRYDESAINILLKSWMKYDLDKIALRDVVTSRNDGRDGKIRARICKSGRDGEL